MKAVKTQKMDKKKKRILIGVFAALLLLLLGGVSGIAWALTRGDPLDAPRKQLEAAKDQAERMAIFNQLPQEQQDKLVSEFMAQRLKEREQQQLESLRKYYALSPEEREEEMKRMREEMEQRAANWNPGQWAGGPGQGGPPGGWQWPGRGNNNGDPNGAAANPQPGGASPDQGSGASSQSPTERRDHFIQQFIMNANLEARALRSDQRLDMAQPQIAAGLPVSTGRRLGGGGPPPPLGGGPPPPPAPP